MLAENNVESVKGLNKSFQLIGDTFSKASKNYKKYSELQDRCSETLRDSTQLSGTVLDLGAGPGTPYDTGAKNVVCIDIALGMLKKLIVQYPDYTAINGDAADLPLQNETIDTVVSNLALQWCDDFKKVTSELYRVLKKEGEIAISLVADNSLTELAELGFKTNNFNSLIEFRNGFDERNWQVLECQVRREVVYFDDLKSLIYSIKGVGASAIKDDAIVQQTQKLRGKSDWLNLVKRAEHSRTSLGLPLTYNIVQIRARKRG